MIPIPPNDSNQSHLKNLSYREKLHLYLEKARKRGSSAQVVFTAVLLKLGKLPYLTVKQWINKIMDIKECTKTTARRYFNQFREKKWIETSSDPVKALRWTVSEKGKNVIYGDSQCR